MLLAVLASPETARAAGLEVPGNGAAAVGRGTAFVAAADDGTAIAYNPGALTRLRGTTVTYSHQVFWENSAFTRAPTAIGQPTVDGAGNYDANAKQSNSTAAFVAGGFLAATTDFGLDRWRFAAGLYGPSASGHKTFAVMGGQRYMLTELDSLLVYPSLAVAYGDADKWGVGVTLQAGVMPKTNMSLVVDASTGSSGKYPLSPYYAVNDVVATIKLKDMTPRPSAIVGAWYRVTPNVDVAASGRVMPMTFHTKGDVSMGNDDPRVGSQFTPDQLSVSNSSAKMDMSFAPTATLAARYRGLDAEGREKWDVEVDAVWEGWHIMKDYDVQMAGKINLFGGDQQMPSVALPKRWRDTFSVRAGGTAHLTDAWSLSAGGYWEQGATPTAYSNLDFPSFDRIGVAGGARFKSGRFSAALSYAHVFQQTREVSEEQGKVFQVRALAQCPDGCKGYSGVPANAGKFESSYDLLTASGSVAF